ncbi:hypothetical protein [Pseudarthrobacter sp. BIM B-2242]|uniref:hypothetical protein n=1 Tax=Pseudarthrobacter sp. BIM B-2242 TaxID=2772401 RepID=UPI00168AD293|nr:hypothetical protein [Pseudarthrobacter sp. BIM B-2242]QOD06058.1 hypothetical protein IDT60_21075 [Pseudarthrobacter sp. BIM B-2242]
MKFFGHVKPGHSAVHPASAPGTGADAVSFELDRKEYFTVFEEGDKSEGRRRAGNFTDYAMAYQAAGGLGIDGGIGEIAIMSPDTVETITVMQADRSLKAVDRVTTWKTIPLASRLQFLSLS